MIIYFVWDTRHCFFFHQHHHLHILLSHILYCLHMSLEKLVINLFIFSSLSCDSLLRSRTVAFLDNFIILPFFVHVCGASEKNDKIENDLRKATTASNEYCNKMIFVIFRIAWNTNSNFFSLSMKASFSSKQPKLRVSDMIQLKLLCHTFRLTFFQPHFSNTKMSTVCKY